MIAQHVSATIMGIAAEPLLIEIKHQGYVRAQRDRYFARVGLPDDTVDNS